MGKIARVPRYKLPPDLPADVEQFMALSVPLSWAIARHLRPGPLTMRELCEALGGADQATVTKRLDAFSTLGLVSVTGPDGVPPAQRQGHVLRYALDAIAFDALVQAWLGYVRAGDAARR